MTLQNFIDQDGSPSISDIAKKLGVALVTVYRYVNGDRIPRPEHMTQLVKISKGEVRPDDFYPECKRALRRFRRGPIEQ